MADKINSRQKGSKNERDVCGLMKGWTEYEFARTPSSGGLRWGRNDTIGDIVCTDEKHSKYFRFAIECKFYKDIRFDHLVNGNKNSDILDFWAQAVSDSERGGKIPLLTMRYNGMKKAMHYVIMDYTFYTEIMHLVPNTYGTLLYDKDEHFIIIINSLDLFEAPYKEIHKIAKTYLKARKQNG